MLGISSFEYIKFFLIRKIEYYGRTTHGVNVLISIPPLKKIESAMAVATASPASDARMVNAARFVGSEVFRREAFGKNHPLSIPRQSGVLDLCGMLGWFDDQGIHHCSPASPEQLARFHDSDYIEALRSSEAAGRVEPWVRERYRIGTMENPLFEGLFERAATAVGGSMLAARLALEGGVVFHPAGGTHHGRPDRASGFCYFNDPVFAILTLLDADRQRVLYIDLDAHHGDGVQDAFATDTRVFTLSIHEANRWPRTGHLEDRGGGRSRNLPVPRGFNDSELDHLIKQAVLPLKQRFRPDAMVVTCGADALGGDPLSRLDLSNAGLWSAVEQVVEGVECAVVLGGGGYNPWTVVRCWSGLWGRLSGQALPDRLPEEARLLLRGFECDLIDQEDVPPQWTETLVDEPNTGPVREAVKRLVQAVLD